MNYRVLGKTGYRVSEVSYGAWAIGGTWGPTEDETSKAAIRAAIEGGVNFFDTADVYGGGRSERLLGAIKREGLGEMIIATKAGRQINPHVTEGYTVEAIRGYVEASLEELGVSCLDLLQLHCPPTPVFFNDAFMNGMKDLIDEGKIAYLGVSVETIEEAIQAMSYDHVSSIQVIFNMFRLKPLEKMLKIAKEKNVGIIARVPLASGMLTGKMKKDSQFAPDDHRSFNRHGEAFDKGETFSGVPYDVGLEAVEALMDIKPKDLTMAQFALAWILQHDAVTCVIPGGKTPEQVNQNIAASGVVLSDEVMSKVSQVYNTFIKEHVHHLW